MISAFSRYSCSFSGKQLTNPQQADVPLSPREDLKLRALQWLHERPENAYLQETNNLASVFPDGPCLTHDKSDIIVADPEGMFYSVFQSCLTDILSVLELIDGLGDPDDVYKRKIKKGTYCADI
jgi:hypothetical protein